MKTVGKYVLIEKEPEQHKTASGIILPSTGTSRTAKGTIVVVGPSAEFVKVGDRVLFHKSQMTDIELEGKKCGIIHEDSCVSIL